MLLLFWKACGMKLKLKLICDRQSVGKSVLVSGTYLGPATHFSFSMKFPLDYWSFFILLRPLWREDGSIIYCTIDSGPCQNSHSRIQVHQNSRPYIAVSFDSPNLEGQVPVFISPRNTVAQLHPWALSSLLVASYDSQGCGGGILTRLHTGCRWYIYIYIYIWGFYIQINVAINMDTDHIKSSKISGYYTRTYHLL
jgi:hypothetical protein